MKINIEELQQLLIEALPCVNYCTLSQDFKLSGHLYCQKLERQIRAKIEEIELGKEEQ